MKTTAIVSTLLASAAFAQARGHGHLHRRKAHPHGNHLDKRVVTEVVTETVWETVTALVDDYTTEYIQPPKPTPVVVPSSTARQAQFFESPNPAAQLPRTSSTAAAPPPPPPPPPPVVVAPPPPPPPPPAPSTSTVAPPPAPVAAPPPAPPAPAPKPAGGSPAPATSAGQYNGDLTYYALGLGACGFDDSGKDHSENIVALSHLLMGTQSNGNPYCNRRIAVTVDGKTVNAVVRDKCMGCDLENIDSSEKMFLELFGSLGVGRGKVSWKFI